jgi:hypothetical protein
LRRHRQQTQQVERDLQPGFAPAVVDQIAVCAVVGGVVEGQAGEHAQHHALGLFAGNAGTVLAFTQVGVAHQGQRFHVFHRALQPGGGRALRRLGHAPGRGCLAGGHAHQGRQFQARGRELLLDHFQQAQVFQQLALVAQRLHRRAQFFGFDLAHIGQRQSCCLAGRAQGSCSAWWAATRQ